MQSKETADVAEKNLAHQMHEKVIFREKIVHFLRKWITQKYP